MTVLAVIYVLFLFSVGVLLIDFRYFSLSFSFVALFTVRMIIDYHYHSSSCWLLHLLILSPFITLVLLLDCSYQSPIYSFLHTYLVLIIFFLFMILFNKFVGLIHPLLTILSFHHSPSHCDNFTCYALHNSIGFD